MTVALNSYALPAALALLGLAGAYLMVRLLFLPLRSVREAISSAREPTTDDRLPAPLGALCLTTGATAAGVLTGTATAVVLGGPGAVLWVMLGGLFSMALRYVEASQAWHSRRFVGDGDRMSAGVAAGLRALSVKAGRPLGLVYAVLALVAAVTALGALPARQLGRDIEASLGLPALAVSAVVAIAALVLSWRSSKDAARIARAVVPIVLGVLGLALIVASLRHAGRVPGAIGRIFGQALEGGSPSAGFLGAFLGETIRQGLARGLFTGSSLGIAASCHGGSGAATANRAGLVASLEPLVASVVLPLLVGVAILGSRAWSSADHPTAVPLAEVRAFSTEPASAAELTGTEIALDGIIRVREGQSYDRFTLTAGTEIVAEPRFELGGEPWDGAIRFAKGEVAGLLEVRGARKALEDVDLGKAERITVTGDGPLFGIPLVGVALEVVLPFRVGRWLTAAIAIVLGLIAVLALLVFLDSLGSGIAGAPASIGARVLVGIAVALGPLVPTALARGLLPWALVVLVIPYVAALAIHASRASSDEDEPAPAPRRPRKKR